jgi:hypothetical protein
MEKQKPTGLSSGITSFFKGLGHASIFRWRFTFNRWRFNSNRRRFIFNRWRFIEK